MTSEADAAIRAELERFLSAGKATPIRGRSPQENPLARLMELIDAKFKIGAPEAQLYLGPNSLAVRGMTLAAPMLEIAKRDSIEKSFEWLDYVYRPRQLDVSVCMAVVGVELPSEITVSQDIRFVPWNVFPSSKMKQLIVDLAARMMMQETGNSPVTAVAIQHFKDMPFVTEKAGQVHEVVHRAETILMRAIQGFTMAGPCAPAPSWSWIETQDRELEAINFSGRSHRILEGMSFYRKGKQPVTRRDVERISKYLEITGPFARTLEIALDRLNLAQCRLRLSNKAIEAAICLEALLGPGREELTHKYSLRGALLLGRRPDVREQIKLLYRFRSAAVHGNDIGNETFDGFLQQKIVDDGIRVCGELLHVLVDHGAAPDWNHLELTGEFRPSPEQPSRPRRERKR